jgi:hypothetical protein
MIQCRSCGSSFTGNFCSNCGAPATPNNSLHCPRCNSTSAPNMAFCSNCGTQLQSPQYGAQGTQYPPVQQPPYPNQPIPQKQNNMGKYLMGALGGAAAVIGGEILMHDVEKGIERHVERDVERREWIGEPHHHHHHEHERHHHHHRRCDCGHEFSIDIDVCPRCRRRWGRW